MHMHDLHSPFFNLDLESAHEMMLDSEEARGKGRRLIGALERTGEEIRQGVRELETILQAAERDMAEKARQMLSGQANK